MIPPVPSNTYGLICIDLALPMGLVKSPDFFCSTFRNVADNANAYVLVPTSPSAIYPPTAEAYHTYAAPQA